MHFTVTKAGPSGAEPPLPPAPPPPFSPPVAPDAPVHHAHHGQYAHHVHQRVDSHAPSPEGKRQDLVQPIPVLMPTRPAPHDHEHGREPELGVAEYDEEPLSFGERVRDSMYENRTLINTFIAGGLAGAASRTAVAPLERLKIILQVQISAPGGQGQAYGGIWSSLVRMWKTEGFAGFMKGNGINVIRILPYSALQFSSYSVFKSMFRQWSGEEQLSNFYRLTAGAGAGIVAVVATYPLDLVRARLSIATANMAQTGGGPSAFTPEDAKLGISGMTKKVYATEGGLRGLYRGCWATAVGVAPYVSLNFFMYENLKNVIMPPDLELGEAEFAARKLACGGLAGAISLLFTHPMDVLRRKLQVAGLSALSPKYNGAIDCMVQTVKQDGFWKGMYRGLVPNFVKIVPSMAVSFYTYDTVNDFLNRMYDEDDDEEELA